MNLSDNLLNLEIGTNSYNLKTYPCIICDYQLDCMNSKEYNDIFKHLAEIHHIIISNTEQILNIPSYLSYWKKRLKEDVKLVDICSVIQTNCKSTDPFPTEFYYVLCDILPEDKQLRDDLQNEELQRVLNCQKLEWIDVDSVNICIFCNEEFKGNKILLFKHMEEIHNFFIDSFENLVFTDELLKILKDNLLNLICLYCEKTFKSPQILKEHMRKKRHKRLRKSNIKYYKFLIPKYLPRTNFDDSNDESEDSELNSNDINVAGYSNDDITERRELINHEKDWKEWVDQESPLYVCLFCSFTDNKIFNHIEEKHLFKLTRIFTDESLTDYHVIKMINYIRRQTYQNICYSCHESFVCKEKLENHFINTEHSSLEPLSQDYDQPQYFFPTYEDDNLLCLVMSLRKQCEQNKVEDKMVFPESSIFDAFKCQ